LYCLNFVIVAELTGTLDVEKIDAALHALQREQPLLRARIVLVDGRLWFKPVSLERCPLKADVKLLRDWRITTVAQLSTPFGATPPLARFFLFRGRGQHCVAAMVFHHVIADGKSGTDLMIRVLRRAAGENRPLRFRRPRPSAQHLDLIERQGLVGSSVRKLEYWLHQGMNALTFPQQLPGYDMHWRPKREIHVIPLSIPKEACRALLEACHAHGTTVHGALGAGQLLALNAEFGVAEARRLALTSLADLRGVLDGELTERDLGLYIATITTVHRIDVEPDFWQLAADIRSQVKEVLESGDANLVHSIYREDSLIPPNEAGARMVQAAAAAAPPSSMITNIGRYDAIALRNGTRVRSLTFMLAPPPQYPICVVAGTYANVIHLNLLYDHAKVTQKQARRIGTSLVRIIRSAARRD